MKGIIKNNILFIFIFFLSFFSLYLSSYNTIYSDTLDSYLFSFGMFKGNIVYNDFNMLTTPLYSFIMSLGLHINNSFIFFLLEHSLLISITYYFIYKLLGKRSLFLIPVTIFLSFSNIVGTYSYGVFFCLILLIYLEEKYNNLDYLIGFIIGLSILNKHIIGIFFIVPSIIFYYKNFNKLFKRFIGLFIPCFIFFTYLIYSSSLYNFLDLTVFGLFNFGDSNGSIIGIEKIIYIIISLLCLVFSIIFIIKHKKDIKLYYLFFGIMFVVPLFDYSHLAFYITCIIIMILFYIRFNKYIFSFLLVISLLYGFSTFSSWFNQKLVLLDLNHFNNTLVLESSNYSRIDKYIDSYKDPIILGYYSKIYTISNDLDVDYYDISNYGNFGYNGTKNVINRIKNTHDQYIIISMDDYNNSNIYFQFYKDVCKYVINHYKLVDSKYNYYVYYKE